MAIGVDASGNVYVTGTSDGGGTGIDYATIKYNSAGQEQWVARGPGNGNDFASALAVDGPGNVYVTGTSAGNTPRSNITQLDNSNGLPSTPAAGPMLSPLTAPAMCMSKEQAVLIIPRSNITQPGNNNGLPVTLGPTSQRSPLTPQEMSVLLEPVRVRALITIMPPSNITHGPGPMGCSLQRTGE